ncbi:MAG TPA: GNAT family N-acetyltransferase [Candidatus Limnocylindrales bacterium]|nr:GNAT family N-acetyltransferase [Candidatus Limnocylindrales bacterium]
MIPGTSRVNPAHVHITIENTRPEHALSLARLQQIVFPSLADDELFSKNKYLKHLELFPEGQFTAIAHHEGGSEPVAATTTFRTTFDFDHIQHTYVEAIADGWLANHDPKGEWLYGVDVSVHPNYRGMRVGRRLYEARRQLVRELNLRGELAGALMPGYAHHHEQMTVAQYVLYVWQGKLHDPTLTVQMRNGFKPRGILYEHISDVRSFNAAALIVRENPFYIAGAPPQPHTAGHARRQPPRRLNAPPVRPPSRRPDRPLTHL